MMKKFFNVVSSQLFIRSVRKHRDAQLKGIRMMKRNEKNVKSNILSVKKSFFSSRVEKIHGLLLHVQVIASIFWQKVLKIKTVQSLGTLEKRLSLKSNYKSLVYFSVSPSVKHYKKRQLMKRLPKTTERLNSKSVVFQCEWNKWTNNFLLAGNAAVCGWCLGNLGENTNTEKTTSVKVLTIQCHSVL